MSQEFILSSGSIPAGRADAASGFPDRLGGDASNIWAWGKFKWAVGELAALTGAKDMLEIGGGRNPMFDQSEIAAMGVRYTSNDISEAELRRAPPFVSKANFDIATRDNARIAPFAGSQDLVFSKMVFEHVKDVRQAYRNIAEILRPDGVCINFHPVLFASPFVVNFVLPEALSRRLLALFFSRRNDEEVPKFPAYYQYCRISPGVRSVLADCGFRRVWQLPFYGHNYYKSIPLFAQMTELTTKVSRKQKFTPLASFCYTILQK